MNGRVVLLALVAIALLVWAALQLEPKILPVDERTDYKPACDNNPSFFLKGTIYDCATRRPAP
jgi:hypothetical protein